MDIKSRNSDIVLHEINFYFSVIGMISSRLKIIGIDEGLKILSRSHFVSFRNTNQPNLS